MSIASHKKLYSVCESAIDDLFSDRSVSASATLEDMEELRNFVDMKIDALKADLGR